MLHFVQHDNFDFFTASAALGCAVASLQGCGLHHGGKQEEKPMNRWATTLVGAVAISAVLYRPKVPMPAPQRPFSAQPAAETAEARPASSAITSSTATPNPCTDLKDNPLEALVPSLALRYPAPREATDRVTGPTQKTPDQLDFLKDPDAVKVLNHSTPLIVTVPDPVHSDLAMWFDRSVDTIVLAAQQSGYNRDSSFWLPWSANPADAAPDCSSRLLRDQAVESRNREPGLLVFQGEDDDQGVPKSLLLVFLVAETPTAGVNKVELSKAVDDIFDWRLPSPIAVAGPVFSGSVHSFMRTLNEIGIRRRVQFNIQSGSITSTGAVDDLGHHCENNSQSCKTAETTLWDDYTRECGLFDFLQPQARSSRRLAFITETGTFFGSPVQKPDSEDESAPNICGVPANDSAWIERVAHKRKDRVIQLQFPRGISHLREAYEENEGIWGQTGNQAAGVPEQFLPLNLKESPTLGGDKPPIFATAQTPLSQEMELTSLSRDLRDENVKYAVIQATDPLDIMFLIRYLKRANPSKQLVVLEPDLLFLRALGDFAPRGLLAMSSYPLFLRNQHWTSPHTAQRVLFPDEYAEALYNACVILLGHSDAALEAPQSNKPTNNSHPDDNIAGRWSPDKGVAPLWFMMVGRDGYWPIDIKLNHNDKSQDPLPNQEPLPSGYRIVWLVLIALSILYPLLLWLADRSDLLWLGRFRLSGCVDRQISQRAFWLFCGAVLILFAQFVATFPVWRAHRVSWIVYVTDGLSVLLLIAAVTWLVPKIFSNQKIRRAGLREPFVLSAIVILSGCAIFLWFWWHAVTANSYYAFFLRYRSAQLWSGVSPVLPLILLVVAFGVLAWTRLSGLILLGARPEMPQLEQSKDIRALPDCSDHARVAAFYKRIGASVDLPDSGTKTINSWDHQQRGDKALRDVFYDFRWEALTAAGFVLALILIAPWGSTLTLESGTFNHAYEIGFVILCWMVLSGCGRLFYILREFNKVLIRLERHPLRQAFSRLPKQYACSPIRNLGGIVLAQKTMAHSINCLRKLAAGTSDCVLYEATSDLSGEVNEITLDVEERRCIPEHKIRYIQSKLRGLAEYVGGRYLAQHWENGYSDSLSLVENAGRTPKTEEKDFESQDRTVVAEEFVALRYVAYAQYTCGQLTYLAFSLAAVFILGVLSVESYPFETHRGMDWIMTLIFVIVGIIFIRVFAGMERDSILSRLSATEPGKLSVEFYLHLATYGALPLFALIAAHFPSIGNFLFSWIRPGLQSIR
jgi:hypothetical protein